MYLAPHRSGGDKLRLLCFDLSSLDLPDDFRSTHPSVISNHSTCVHDCTGEYVPAPTLLYCTRQSGDCVRVKRTTTQVRLAVLRLLRCTPMLSRN